MGVNAVTLLVSALLIGTLRGADIAPEARDAVRTRVSLWSDARAGVRALLAVPSVKTLLACSTGVVLCVGVTNVGEVVLAREVLGVRGSGLALMITAGGVG